MIIVLGIHETLNADNVASRIYHKEIGVVEHVWDEMVRMNSLRCWAASKSVEGSKK